MSNKVCLTHDPKDKIQQTLQAGKEGDKTNDVLQKNPGKHELYG